MLKKELERVAALSHLLPVVLQEGNRLIDKMSSTL